MLIRVFTTCGPVESVAPGTGPRFMHGSARVGEDLQIIAAVVTETKGQVVKLKRSALLGESYFEARITRLLRYCEDCESMMVYLVLNSQLGFGRLKKIEVFLKWWLKSK